jgi:hypothetical protein
MKVQHKAHGKNRSHIKCGFQWVSCNSSPLQYHQFGFDDRHKIGKLKNRISSWSRLLGTRETILSR